ncbi:MAG: aspartate-semialdehyde dehydrogenase [Christensenellales bacterium]|jgi:aspartate-semialdehyde dehydrogenase
MDKYRVGIIGATGMVGQRLALLLANHPWFTVTVLAASSRSAGKSYAEAVEGRWKMETPVPANLRGMQLEDAAHVEAVAEMVDLVFCAVNMNKDDIRKLEEAYARAEVVVISNNSANRMAADVPMIIPELNSGHLQVLKAQRTRLGTRKGFIVAKSNCSIQSYVPALHPLLDFGVREVLACTYQAISGAGKTFADWPEMQDNVIPYISGEEEKSEKEPLKIWGSVKDGLIVSAESPVITTQCIRIPVTDGHMAAVFVRFEKKPSLEEIIDRWRTFKARPQILGLPSAPHPFLYYFDEPDRPQTRLDRDIENGMSVSIGRLREDAIFDCRFVCLSHNTLRGAAGGGVLLAELLCAEGYVR